MSERMGEVRYFKSRKYHIVIVLLSLIYSACAVLGYNIENYDEGRYTDIRTYLKILLLTVVFKLLIDLIVYVFSRIKQIPSLDKLNSLSDMQFFLLGWVGMLLAYIPTWIACFPGLAIYDGPGQAATWSRHHPFLHTAFVHFCVFVEKQTGVISWLLVYSLIQLILFALAFAFIFLKMRRFGIPNLYLVVLFIITLIFPLNGLMAITTTKDVLFAVAFALWVIEVIRVIKEDNYFSDKKNIMQLILFSFLMCALRNNGQYVFVASGLILFFFMEGKKKRWAIFVVAFALIFGIISGPVLTLAGVPKGNVREALSVVIQPLARTYGHADDSLSEEDRGEIERLFGGNAPWYISHISDAPKSQFDSEEFGNNKAEYLKLYITKGLQFPTIYMDAILATTYANWYPYDTLPDDSCFRLYFEFPEITPEEFGSKLGGYYTFLQNFSRNSSYNRIVPFRILISTGFAFWVILAGLAYAIINRQKKLILSFVPPVMLWGTIMLGPVALFRYTYPLMIVNVVICGLIFMEIFAKKDKDSI